MNQGCALLILRSKSQRSRSWRMINCKWFPDYNWLCNQPMIMKLHTHAPHESRMCWFGFYLFIYFYFFIIFFLLFFISYIIFLLLFFYYFLFHIYNFFIYLIFIYLFIIIFLISFFIYLFFYLFIFFLFFFIFFFLLKLVKDVPCSFKGFCNWAFWIFDAPFTC